MVNDPHIPSWKFKKYRDPVFLISTFSLLLAVLGIVVKQNFITLFLVIFTFAIWAIVVYFFRDPSRTVVNQPGLVVGPCDGEVVSIETLDETNYLNSKVIRISIFLSLFDVHVQRAPMAGTVALVDHKPGEFLQAFKPEASEVNEYIAMRLETAYGSILVKQIAGILARRCMNYAHPGSTIETGQRFGHIKFGSRVDLYLPPEAELKIRVGDKIYGGLTPMAQLEGANE